MAGEFIKMRWDCYGCDNGHDVHNYRKGETYEIGVEIGEMLALDFIRREQAVFLKQENL